MNANKFKHQHQLQSWAPVIRDCKNSGMTVRAWCEKNDINEKRFYYWQRKVREEVIGSLEVSTSAIPETTFVQMSDTIQDKASFRPDMILKINGQHLEISNTVSEDLLAMVMRNIRHAE